MKLSLGLIPLALLALGLRCSAAPGIDSARLVDELGAAPAWASMTADDIAVSGSRLMEVVAKFAALPPAECRALVDRYLGRYVGHTRDDVGTWSKVYILNRYYFAVPEKEARPKVKFFGGWGGAPKIDAETVALVWPLTKTTDGQFLLTGHMSTYMGPKYQPLAEFDYFSSLYGVRKLAKP